jgi:hypothetical protein
MPKNSLLNGARGKYNAMKYEMSKEAAVDESSLILKGLGFDNDMAVDRSNLDKIIELSEK